MFIRRLIVLFITLGIVGVVLITRLSGLQLSDSQKWEQKAKTFTQRHTPIETSRGTIEDRLGRPLAIDEPAYDLAIDYRAMNLDDVWLTRLAKSRLIKQGYTTVAQRRPYLADAKRQIAEQVERIPDLIAQKCGIPREQILERYQSVRARIASLRQRVLKYNKDTDAEAIARGDYDLDWGVEFREERTGHTLVAAIPTSLALELQKVLDDYPGLMILDSKHRAHPYKDVAAHVIGYMRPVDDPTRRAKPFERPDLSSDEQTDEPGNLRGYLAGDRMGAVGVERYAEDVLRGARGVRLITLEDTDQEKRIDPVPGQNVRVTLDIELQKELQTALQNPRRGLLRGEDGKDHNVAMVVLNILNGDVLCMLSLPSFDLDRYDDDIVKLINDEANIPLLNRAIASVYPPGSTIKPIVAAAALMNNEVTPSEQIVCHGYLYPNNKNAYRCMIYRNTGHGHGPIDLIHALEQSCNIYFYTMGQRVGLDRLINTYDMVGFGRRTGLGLREETDGDLLKPGSVKDADRARVEATFMAIGQGRISTTPLQMANAYATLLRGGVSLAPRVILGEGRTPVRSGTINPTIVQTIHQGMMRVVNGEHGTARSMRLRIPIGGKTGSAEATRTIVKDDGSKEVISDSDAWFVGYVPADRPQYVIAAVMEFGGHGGTMAVPMVREAILAMEKRGYLPAMDVQP